MTALYFEHLRAPDRVSVKPHAAPVLHAIKYLLGRLDRALPDELRAVRRPAELSRAGSRTRSRPTSRPARSGIGATATIWSALAHRYVAGHFEVPQGGRQIALLGDAELDEGAIWEAHRRPGRAAASARCCGSSTSTASRSTASCPTSPPAGCAAMFEAAGWHTHHASSTAAASASCSSATAAPRCATASTRCRNEEYQRLLRSRSGRAARAAARPGAAVARSSGSSATLDDDELGRAIRDLGGHDLADLLDALRRGGRGHRPAVGDLRLHDQGLAAADARAIPANHSALLYGSSSGSSSPAELGADAGRPVGARSTDGTRAEAQLCARAAERLEREQLEPRPAAPPVPARRRPRAHRRGVDPAGVRPLLRRPRARRARRRRARRDGQPRRRLLDEPRRLDQPRRDLEPRASGSTGSPTTPTRWCAGARPSTASTSSSGIAEGNLVGLLGELGADLVARRPAAAADRDALRPVRQPRARAVVVRHLRGRAVDPRRHAFGRHARARGRRAPVDHHAVGRPRAAALHRLGAGLRPGPRVDAAARPRRCSAAPAARRRTSG